jgi:hypothetical protein
VNRLVGLLALSAVVAQPLSAQTVIRPEPPLDSARAVLRDALLVMRDSLLTIDGAAARLQRDYRVASGPSLLSRARVMRDACARSGRTVPPTRQVILSAKLSEPHKAKRRQELLGALEQLTSALSQCETEFDTMSQAGQAERVRGYANDRAHQVQISLRTYEQSARNFLGALGIRVVPMGVVPEPQAES